MRTEDCRGSRKKQETIALWFQGADRTRGALPPEVRDKNFAVAIAGAPLGGVGELYVLDMEAVEQFPNLRDIIQRQHKLAAQTTKPFFERLEVMALEVVSVQGASPVWRVEIEERRWPVVALENFFIRERFDLNPLQAVVATLEDA